MGGVNEVGSGVLISPDGKVITAAHVVQTADEITAEFLGGEVVNARVVASEPEADVSLLQLDRVPAQALVARFGNSDRAEVGDQIFIIGAPYGIGHTLSVGYVTGRRKPNTVYSEMALAEFFQTDAAINPGNSGGPMFNMAGEVIGIASHNISKSGGSEGLGFVVTINMARRLLLEQRSFWSGMSGVIIGGQVARARSTCPRRSGSWCSRSRPSSPAARIGLKAGHDPRHDRGQVASCWAATSSSRCRSREIGTETYEALQARLQRPARRLRHPRRVLRDGQRVSLEAARTDAVEAEPARGHARHVGIPLHADPRAPARAATRPTVPAPANGSSTAPRLRRSRAAPRTHRLGHRVPQAVRVRARQRQHPAEASSPRGPHRRPALPEAQQVVHAGCPSARASASAPRSPLDCSRQPTRREPADHEPVHADPLAAVVAVADHEPQVAVRSRARGATRGRSRWRARARSARPTPVRAPRTQ